MNQRPDHFLTNVFLVSSFTLFLSNRIEKVTFF